MQLYIFEKIQVLNLFNVKFALKDILIRITFKSMKLSMLEKVRINVTYVNLNLL